MILTNTSHKYHVNRAITLEYIQKLNYPIFLRLTVPESFLKKKTHTFFRNFHDFDHFSVESNKNPRLILILTILTDQPFFQCIKNERCAL